MSPELSNTIRILINDFVAGNESDPDIKKLQRTAEKFGLLPIGFFWDPVCITPGGDLVSFTWDGHEDQNIETDPRLINSLLYQGIKKYPELVELMPLRGENDVDCEHCGGTGIDPLVSEHGLFNIVCYCGGLGWLPKEE